MVREAQVLTDTAVAVTGAQDVDTTDAVAVAFDGTDTTVVVRVAQVVKGTLDADASVSVVVASLNDVQVAETTGSVILAQVVGDAADIDADAAEACTVTAVVPAQEGAMAAVFLFTEQAVVNAVGTVVQVLFVVVPIAVRLE